ncbi:MAG: hypothetical protein KL787_05350 [Taibaiella sp.]|nr:hypothetical protein [Taibaiella sp.]
MDRGRNSVTGKLETNDEVYYGFIHKVFFEYFLGSYAARMENNNAQTKEYKNIHFNNQPLAQEVFIFGKVEKGEKFGVRYKAKYN